MTLQHTIAAAFLAASVAASAQCGPEPVTEPEPPPTAAAPLPFVLHLGAVTMACVAESENVAICDAGMLGPMRCYLYPDSPPACYDAQEDDAEKERRQRMVEELTR